MFSNYSDVSMKIRIFMIVFLIFDATGISSHIKMIHTNVSYQELAS